MCSPSAARGSFGDPMMRSPPLGSVVIPAYNEARVIQRCLGALFTGFAPEELDVIVACNGCRDHTARIARSSSHPVRVLELAEASKPAALRAADSAACAFPRLYLDADVVLPGRSARLVLERLRNGAVAARPPLRYDSSASSAPVRSYYRARSQVPAVLGSLWGAGVYGLSAAGRARFETFPDLVADDLWIDRQFEPHEIEIVDCPPVVVAVPRRSRDLLRTLNRTYRGKEDHRPPSGFDERARETTAAAVGDLRRLAEAGPRGAADAAAYAAFALTARLTRTLAAAAGTAAAAAVWERDESSRVG
jgi:glycosyltransferase involved in cell wall biosynthesis